MIGIVGVPLSPERLKEQLTAYLTRYYDALDKAIDEAGGSLNSKVLWPKPEFPAELRPSWAAEIRCEADGQTFYIDVDGPVQHGVHVTQAIVISTWWHGENNESFYIDRIEIDPMRIFLVDDTYLDLGEARAVTNGLISAGKLMTSLLEPPQEVR